MAAAATGYVNTLAEVFIDHNREERWSPLSDHQRLAGAGTEELKTKLEDSEQQLIAYATETGHDPLVE